MYPSAWDAALDDLECRLATADNALGHLLNDAPGDDNMAASGTATPGAWTPPGGLGPLPSHLAPRAAALVDALNDAARRTAGVRDDTVRQLSAVRSVPLSVDGGSSVYLDVSG